jgi:hypothetical protein
MDDGEWMYTGRTNQFDFSKEWMRKTDDFLELAFGKTGGRPLLALCPCSKCGTQEKAEQGEHG